MLLVDNSRLSSACSLSCISLSDPSLSLSKLFLSFISSSVSTVSSSKGFALSSSTSSSILSDLEFWTSGSFSKDEDLNVSISKTSGSVWGWTWINFDCAEGVVFSDSTFSDVEFRISVTVDVTSVANECGFETTGFSSTSSSKLVISKWLPLKLTLSSSSILSISNSYFFFLYLISNCLGLPSTSLNSVSSTSLSLWSWITGFNNFNLSCLLLFDGFNIFALVVSISVNTGVPGSGVSLW